MFWCEIPFEGSLLHSYKQQTIGRLLGVCKNKHIDENES